MTNENQIERVCVRVYSTTTTNYRQLCLSISINTKQTTTIHML